MSKLNIQILTQVYLYLQEQLASENGEFDNDSDLLSAVERTLKMLEE
jgi:hypothetical protein|tara:strand:+ start:1028 stop:1168 length:141 start_codon:yes stop_codon:yes gene_type:complete